MINTHRIIAILLVINIFNSLALEMYQNPTTYSTSVFESSESDYKNETNYLKDVTANPERQDLETEGTILDTMKFGLKVVKIVARGINPFSINRTQTDTWVEKIILDIMSLFKFLFAILLIIEVYMIIKNKKTS